MSDARNLFDAVTVGDGATALRLAEAAPGLLDDRDTQGATPILKALYHGQADIAKSLAAIKPSLNLFEAAALGRLERVCELLEADSALIDAIAPDGFPLISLAAFFGRDAIVARLIERGANVNVVSTNGMNLRPIHAAAARNDENIMRKLLEAGANPDVQQQGGWTALHSAARHGNAALLTLLLQYDADVSLRSEDGQTARDMAHESLAQDIIKRL